MAENIIDILLIAYKLSLLTFYIGVLIYALPIPWRSFKRWGPTLIVDGIFSMALVMAFSLIFIGVEELQQLLGGSWTFYFMWLSSLLNWVLTVKTLLLTLKLVLSLSPVSGVYSTYFLPFERSLDALYITVGWLMGMGYLIGEYGKYLAAIGVALYSIPFRVARSAGAWMLSFAVVFSIGLPVMPSFIASIAELPEPPDIGEIQDLGVALAMIEAYDYKGFPFGYGVIYIYHEEYGQIAREKVELGTVLDDTYITIIPVPSRDPVVYAVEIYGVTLYMEPLPMYPRDYEDRNGIWYGTLTTPNLVWTGAHTILYTTGEIVDIEAVVSDTGGWIVTVNLPSGTYAEVMYPTQCEVSITTSPGTNATTRYWNWYNLQGHAVRITAGEPGSYNITVVEEECTSLWPKLPDTENMLENRDLGWNFISIDVFSSVIVYYVTVPLIYIFILLVITFGLSRLLGGRDRYVPKF